MFGRNIYKYICTFIPYFSCFCTCSRHISSGTCQTKIKPHLTSLIKWSPINTKGEHAWSRAARSSKKRSQWRHWTHRQSAPGRADPPVLEAEDEEEENQVEEPQTTQKEPQKKKTRQKKTYIVENTRDTWSKRATVCDNTSTAKRIKY